MAEEQNEEPLPEPPAASDAAAPVPAPVPATASSLDGPSAATQFAPSMIMRERQIAQGKLDREPLGGPQPIPVMDRPESPDSGMFCMPKRGRRADSLGEYSLPALQSDICANPEKRERPTDPCAERLMRAPCTEGSTCLIS